jgi:hypothetical protein
MLQVGGTGRQTGRKTDRQTDRQADHNNDVCEAKDLEMLNLILTTGNKNSETAVQIFFMQVWLLII